ncbi:MarR family winged helix-turn-helix transcriptional regulator [Aureibacter tunicatorum]|uniref:DNA-binding MarR family transcriptional regulator n=1 Tax=Aureibacter tunicatorum TaxID=866807 RepID=A0AAE4BS64_9BACT|nr:MarR family transcriptional regulator [Aureibacter tunicatorum]MDR6238032.1 DNA-binding MarR family transcriptional regulator [Aureibacter tunicatorum]BDD03065.1 organic hydroperoxide resistance transcriptional regulator [Aureibacter tunicatorum]
MSTENTDSIKLEDQLCFPLYAASRLITQLYNSILSDLDISYPQYLTLMVLWDKGDSTVGELSKALILESNTLTPMLKRMESKGIISRKRSQTDERIVMISLTQKGKDMKSKAMCIPEKLIQKINAENSDSKIPEVNQLKESLYQLIDLIKKQ